MKFSHPFVYHARAEGFSGEFCNGAIAQNKLKWRPYQIVQKVCPLLPKRKRSLDVNSS